MAKKTIEPAESRADGAAGAATAPPLWERLVAIAHRGPKAEHGKQVTDRAEQHDHYVYGTPKTPKP